LAATSAAEGRLSCPGLKEELRPVLAKFRTCRIGRRDPEQQESGIRVVGIGRDVTRRGDLVLDLFLGSGTTLLAAERTGRRFRGLDIDPAYVDVAIERWSARTGLKPRLEGSTS